MSPMAIRNKFLWVLCFYPHTSGKINKGNGVNPDFRNGSVLPICSKGTQEDCIMSWHKIPTAERHSDSSQTPILQ